MTSLNAQCRREKPRARYRYSFDFLSFFSPRFPPRPTTTTNVVVVSFRLRYPRVAHGETQKRLRSNITGKNDPFYSPLVYTIVLMCIQDESFNTRNHLIFSVNFLVSMAHYYQN